MLTETFGLSALVVLVVILLVFVSVSLRLTEIRTRMAVLFKIESKLDLLLKQANIKFDPYTNLPAEIVDAVRAGQTIEAIKLYRQSTGVGLKEAKEFIEQFQQIIK
jgi:hypothetical protein